MKKRLLAALIAALLLLTSCGYIVVDDNEETVLSYVLGSANAEEAQYTDMDVQKRLIELGFLKGNADGIFGPLSVQALKDFQTFCGLEPTGEKDEATMALLFGDPAALPTPTPTPPSEYTDINIQKRLIELGFLKGKADGYFGPRSVQALKDFQTFCGLEPTGEKDEATLALLFGDPAALPTPSPTPLANGAWDAEGVNDVYLVQERLIELNYLSGKPDGIFGPGTEKALMAFQELNGLEVTGIADEATVKALNASAAMPMPTPEPTPRARGARGDEIKQIQEALRIMGFLSGNADGDFGPATEEAVKRYQQYVYDEEQAYYAANPTVEPTLEPTVEPTPEPTPELTLESTPELTVEPTPAATEESAPETTKEPAEEAVVTAAPTAGIELITQQPSEDAAEESEEVPTENTEEESADESAAEPTAEPAEEPVWEPDGIVTDELMEDILSFEHVVLYREDMQRGSKGDEVVRLQRRLASLWYLSSYDVDGQFGPNTAAALKYFQKRNNLEQTGVADEATQMLLFSADAIKSDRPYHMYKIKVSVADQRVYVYKWVNGDYTELVKTMICSTGTKTDPTPLGTYSAAGPAGRWYYFKKFECWAQYAYRISGPYLFHSVIYSEKDESTLRQGSVNALGSRASHGCIRLKVEDAKWIYNNCPAGTTVVVY